MKIKILVALHKPYFVPREEIYLPVEVGAALRKTPLSERFIRDCGGDNISSKNPNYCELTALYWGWKNLPKEIEAVGLVHYRRHFASPASGFLSLKKAKDRIIHEAGVTKLLESVSLILPKQRNYYIESVESQYSHAHHPEDLRVLREVIRNIEPDALPALEEVLSGRKVHLLNMFIMKRELFDRYCNWLFQILFEVERRLDISSYSSNDCRVFGFLAERLMDVWISVNRIPYAELPLVQLEPTNWIKKGADFLKRKYLGRSHSS